MAPMLEDNTLYREELNWFGKVVKLEKIKYFMKEWYTHDAPSMKDHCANSLSFLFKRFLIRVSKKKAMEVLKDHERLRALEELVS